MTGQMPVSAIDTQKPQDRMSYGDTAEIGGKLRLENRAALIFLA
jgi:hypothetical protein